MTQNCWAGKIRSNGNTTMLEGMLMTDHGFSIIFASCAIVMRQNGDLSSEESGVCSCTEDRDGNAWHDDHHLHWGNGLEVWLR